MSLDSQITCCWILRCLHGSGKQLLFFQKSVKGKIIWGCGLQGSISVSWSLWATSYLDEEKTSGERSLLALFFHVLLTLPKGMGQIPEYEYVNACSSDSPDKPGFDEFRISPMRNWAPSQDRNWGGESRKLLVNFTKLVKADSSDS